MNEEVREVIGVEHLKTVLSTLTPEDIVKHAYKEWYPCQRTGHTILNRENIWFGDRIKSVTSC